MAINSVNNSYGYPVGSAYDTAKAQNATAEAAEAMAEKTEGAKAAENKDTFVRQYVPDTQTVYEMKADLNTKMSAFKAMVQGLVQKQAGYAGNAGVVQVPENIRLAAQEAISEDGEWGVEKTATRILDFAKALSGGDPSKFETLKNAIEKGFKEAERILGGKLPDISQRTYKRVMEGLDAWQKELNGTAAAAEEE